MDNQKISMPTEAEKQRAIARILDAGLPRRVAFGRELREVLQRVGPRALLFGVGDCLALSLLIWALCLLSALSAAGTGSLGPALFLFSPRLYAALSLLTAWKDVQTGTWEWRDLPGLRPDRDGPADAVLRRGVGTGVRPGQYAVVDLHRAGDISLCWMVALSLASLCLYGALSLLCQRLRGPAGWLAAPTGWVLMGLISLIWPRTAEWLTAIPTVVFCLLAAAGITLYLLELRCFCRRPMEGGVSYALR